MAGTIKDTTHIERIHTDGFVDVEFIAGKVRVAVCRGGGTPYVYSELEEWDIVDLIGALQRALRKVRKAEA